MMVDERSRGPDGLILCVDMASRIIERQEGSA